MRNLDQVKDSTILIVDDNPTYLDLLFNYLSNVGFRILLAQNGESALEQALEEKPNLILLDVIMPEMDGLKTCRLLKSSLKVRDIPVIFMSALGDSVDKVNGFEAGAVDYIAKPIYNEEMLARITAHLIISKQRRKLIELNASKDSLLTIISHDMRNAFTSLLGYAEFLSESTIEFTPEESQQIATGLNDAIKKTYKLLGNLLDWAKLQRGEMIYHPQRIDLNEMVSTTVDFLWANANKKNIRVIFDVNPECRAYADQNMINTTLRNLVTNAIKFTDDGGLVEVRAHNSHIDGENCMEITVKDNGVGISVKRLGLLFRIDENNKIKTEGTDGEAGTGLGLILCKELIEKNRGHIWAESNEGMGSTFHFTLPASAPMWNPNIESTRSRPNQPSPLVKSYRRRKKNRLFFGLIPEVRLL
ncbi:MAG: hypothetical protein B6244_05955 [Candidatus Cloacimonetes bacterium 4572_55]|nr:MAG: hypothetical protein B6244_05955 [Candidatus Cloacimonetes bacterium 4572_55]